MATRQAPQFIRERASEQANQTSDADDDDDEKESNTLAKVR